MHKESYNVVGVMSGTSLDGVDLIHTRLSHDGSGWTFELFEAETIAYSDSWKTLLSIAIGFSETELAELNANYTLLLAAIIRDFIERNEIANPDAVCSHGHTILHQPEKGLTLQIGNLPELANVLNQHVVCDFRIQDIELGGQGAPLVPIGDRLLFPQYDYCLNLGGFSNISFESDGKRLAFDICPINTVLNNYANKLGVEYDDQGKVARSGKINEKLLLKLNNLEFYRQPFPKSLGFEFVKDKVLPVMERFSIPIADKLATFTEHAAIQIASVLTKKSGELLVTGGGAYNAFLLERLQSHLTDIKIIIPEKAIIEYKEALIFALLGVLKLRNEINVLSSVTGASNDHSSGVIFR